MATAVPPATRPENRSEAFVRRQIAAARARIRWLDIGSAALVLAGITLAYGLSVALLDRLLGLSEPVRQASLLAYLAGAGVYALFGLVRPLWRDINPYYAARRVEQTLPDAKNSLVNWLDLHDEALPPAIQAAVAARAARDLEQADLQEAVGNRPLVAAGTFFGVLVALAVVALIFWRGQFLPLLGRAFLPFQSAAVPAQTALHLLDPADGNTTVAVNYPVDVRVRVEGRVPRPGRADSLRLMLRYRPTDPTWVEVPLAEDEKDPRVWSARVPAAQVQTGFWYKVAGGDAETPEYQVQVRARPLFTAFEVTVTPPAYTRLPELVSRNPNVSGYKGSVVTLLADTNREAGSGRLEVKGGARVAGEKVADRPQSLRYRFPLLDDGQYAVSFASAEGEPSAPATYKLTAFRDEVPQVELTAPAEPVVLLPTNGTLTAEGLAGDDFGLTALRLRLKVRGGPELKARPYRQGQSLKLEIGAFPRRLEYKEVVELEKLQTADGEPAKLKAGQEIEFFLEAIDNCEPTANVGRSARTGVVRLLDPTRDEKKQEQQNKDREKARKDKADHDKKQDEKLKQENEARKDEEKRAAEQARKDNDKARAEKKEGGKGEDDKKPDAGDKNGEKQPGEQGGEQPADPEQQRRDEELRKQAEDLAKKLGGDKGDKQGDKAENKPDGEPNAEPPPPEGNKDEPKSEPKGDPKGGMGGDDKSEKGDSKGSDKAGGSPGGEGKDGGNPEPKSDPADEKPKGDPKASGGKEGDPKPEPKDGGKEGGEGKAGKPGDSGKPPMNGSEKPDGKPENQAGEPKGAGGTPKPQDGGKPGEKPMTGDKPAGDEQPKAGSSKPDATGKRGETKESPEGGGEGDKPEAGEGKAEKGGKPSRGEKKDGPKEGGDPAGEDAADGKDAGKESGPGGKPADKGDAKSAGKADPKAGPEQARGEPKGDGDKKGGDPGKGTEATKKPGDPMKGGNDPGDGTGEAPSKDEIRDLARQMQKGDAKAREDAARKLDEMAKLSPDERDRKAAEEALKDPGKAASGDAGKPGKAGTKPGEKEPAAGEKPAGNEPGGKPGEGTKKPTGNEGARPGEKPSDAKPAPDPKLEPGEAGPGGAPKPAPKGDPGAATGEPKKPADPKAEPTDPKPVPKEGDGPAGDPGASESKPGPNPTSPVGADGSGATQAGDRTGTPRGQGAPGDAATPSTKADADAARRAGELRLDDLKKLPKEKLKDLGMTEAEYREFLKAYEEMLSRKGRPVPNDTVKGGTGGPSRVNETGVKRLGPSGDKADALERGGPLQPPREFQPGFRSFTEKLARPDGK